MNLRSRAWVATVALGISAGAALSSAPAAAAAAPTPTGNATAAGLSPVFQTSSPAAIAGQAAVVGSSWDPQSIVAPGGRALQDRSGRVVTLHGVNAVYKRAPYELAIAPGQPFNFSVADAAAIAGAGFDVVRLGILWEGLEPGGAMNDPSVCTPGNPQAASRFSAATAEAYLSRIAGVVDLLGTFHVHTLIDMHQDVYAEAFRGEGAPPWAVCTDNQPLQLLPDRWSNNYASPSLNVAESHFWENDVVGNLQGQYDQVWSVVAARFRTSPWVVGYDPYNEPFSRQADLVAGSVPPMYVATDLECFYTGRLHPGLVPGTHNHIQCPATDPALGVIPTIEAADPNHLVFVEPDIYEVNGAPSTLGPMPFPRLVFNVHAYCSNRNPVTGAPASATGCAAEVTKELAWRAAERLRLASAQQPGGPPIFLSEFGATSNPTVLESVMDTAGQMQLGWAYWSWKYYSDPTGSSDEPLATAGGRLLPQMATLATPYAEAVAGDPTATDFDPSTQVFTLSYAVDPQVTAPSVIVTLPARYPGGYCATAAGAQIVSPAGASHLLLQNDPGAKAVTFRLAPGSCPPSPGS